jgi:hypothetical protein
MLTASLSDVVQHAGVLIVGQKHDELAALQVARGADKPVVIDLVSLDRAQVAGDDYKGICW